MRVNLEIDGNRGTFVLEIKEDEGLTSGADLRYVIII